MEKKDSIFSGLNPEPSGRPGVSDQEVSALKQKMEMMEKNIVSQLERKIGEQLKASVAPVPPPPPPGAPRPPEANAQVLLARITELDKRLEEFARSAVMSSAQMKNIEESKISARREIEDLLKVVREQQKYSELDRQMHDQLEKAWVRVEDLEKKLMDFYTLSVNKSASEEKGRIPALADEVEDLIGAKLDKFLTEMDSRFNAVAAKLGEYTPAMARRSEERIAMLTASLDARLTAFETDFRKVSLGIASSEDAVRMLYTGIKAEMLAVLQDSLREQNAAVQKHMDGFVLDTQERMNEMSRIMLDHMDELLTQGRQDGLRLDKVEGAVAINAEKSRASMLSLGTQIDGMFQKYAADIGSRIQAENAKNAGEIMEFSRLSAYSLAGAASLSANMDELGGRLDALKEKLKVFVDGMKTVKLESLLGVSGAVARKNFEGVRSALGEMEKELAFFDKMKAEITGNLKTMADRTGKMP
jgi:hypothetical protein